MDGATRLFVYGTLMPGDRLWPVLAPYASAWHDASAPGQLWDTGAGYPAVRFDPAGGPVQGVVVILHAQGADEAVEVLDEVEEEGVLYGRVVIETSAGPAFAYEWLGSTDGLVPLPGGWPRRR